MSTAYGKSLASWISDICGEQGAAIQWKISTSSRPSGEAHQEILCSLRCTFTNDVLESQGSGESDTEAKDDAASKMLFELLGYTRAQLFYLRSDDEFKISGLENYLVPFKSLAEATCPLSPGSVNVSFQESDTDIEPPEPGQNYVGALQEVCAQRHWELPTYNNAGQSGPSHSPEFLIRCTLGPIEKTAKGKSKKDAKARAAYLVFDALRSCRFNLRRFTANTNGASRSPNLELASGGNDGEMDDVVSKMRSISLHEEPSSYKQEFVEAYQDIIQSFLSSNLEERKTHAVYLLDWICKRAGITVKFYEPLVFVDCDEGRIHSVVKMILPFCNYSPKFSAVEATGVSKLEAVQECAIKALCLLVEK